MIFKNFTRLSNEVITAYRALGGKTATISDAMGRAGYMCAEIKPLVENAVIVGSALTVRCPVGGNVVLHKAIDIAKPGDIIVADAERHTATAVWGFLMSFSSMKKGIQGFVVDGAIRDVDAVRSLKFPVFARGVCGRGPHKANLGEINVAIQCGGVPVSPGDLIVGDGDGVVVVPKDSCQSVLEKTKTIIGEENSVKTRLEEGKSHKEIFQFVKDENMKAMGYTIKE